jgi:hypothetical protein
MVPGKFYQIFEEELVLILLKFFPKNEEVGTLPNSFYKGRIILIPSLNETTRKENYRLIFLVD